MNVTVYHEPWGGGLGGAEVVSATIAHALRDAGTVRLLTHHDGLTADRLAAFAGVDLDGVSVECVPPAAKGWQAWDAPPWRLGRDLRAWQAELSRGADLFVGSTHAVPPFNFASRGMLYVHFPNYNRRRAWPWNAGDGLKARARRWLHERQWRARFAGFGVKVVNSRFTAGWTAAYWGGQWDVLPPPVRTDFPVVPKTDSIAAVGRFTPMKRQADIVRVFRERFAPRHPGWRLVCVGSRGKTAEDVAYFDEVRALAAGGSVHLLADATPDELRAILAGAKVFWHAAGFGIDADREPHRLEHFGIATVEAMAAECVPVVPDRGGQPEIVRHGLDGYVCAAVEELADRTAELVADPAGLATMATAARERAQSFSRERFVADVRTKAHP